MIVQPNGTVVAVDWETRVRRVLGNLPITETVLAASGDGRWVAMVDSYADGEFRLFELGATAAELTASGSTWPRDVESAFFLPDGETLLVVTADNVLSIALTDPLLRATTLFRNDGITGLAVRPDGVEIAVAHGDGHIDLVELAGLQRRTIDRPDESISIDTLAYSGDGELLASLSGTGDLYLHDVGSGRLLMRTQWWPLDLLALGDGSQFLTVTPTGVVRWDFAPAQLADAACSLAGRQLTHEEWTTYMPAMPYSPTCG